MNKNGFLYIYVSNETENRKVFFDNLSIQHTTGPITEETHYYPFGLTMAGISSKALRISYAKNRRGFNGNELQNKEFSDGSGLEFYDFNARTYDQQIGRFMQVDPESEKVGQESWAPYHFGFNNPILQADPDGTFPAPVIAWGIRAYRMYRAVRTAREISKQLAREAPKEVAVNMVITTDVMGQTTVIREDQYFTYVAGREKTRLMMEKHEKEEKIGSLNERANELQGEIKSLGKSVNSLEKNVKEHEQKLEDYKNDPDKYDNLGQLQGVSPAMRQQRIDGRIKSLEKQIKKNAQELKKKQEEVKQKKEELKKTNQELNELQ